MGRGSSLRLRMFRVKGFGGPVLDLKGLNELIWGSPAWSIGLGSESKVQE